MFISHLHPGYFRSKMLYGFKSNYWVKFFSEVILFRKLNGDGIIWSVSLLCVLYIGSNLYIRDFAWLWWILQIFAYDKREKKNKNWVKRHVNSIIRHAHNLLFNKIYFTCGQDKYIALGKTACKLELFLW